MVEQGLAARLVDFKYLNSIKCRLILQKRLFFYYFRSKMRGAAGGQEPSYGAPHQTHMLEEENDKMVDSLSNKVQVLKSLTIDIGNEVRTQNNMLKGMDDDFDKSGSFLSATMNRLSTLTKKGHHWVMCYLLLFCLFVFFVVYYIKRSR